jgi:hypothetical protein
MSEQQSKRTRNEDVSRMDHLLGVLGDLSRRDPSPTLRDRLSVLASQRLKDNPGRTARLRALGRRPFMWLKPTFAVACIVAATLATGFAVHFFGHGHVQNAGTAKANPPAISPETRARTVPAARPFVGKSLKVNHSHSALVQPRSPQQMTMRLPYSNGAIETGTDSTIRVSISQSELLSLGFPINATVQDRRIVAELTLGDDGLPRAISLPLPLEVIKEKQ